jgi:hypothetical protein
MDGDELCRFANYGGRTAMFCNIYIHTFLGAMLLGLLTGISSIASAQDGKFSPSISGSLAVEVQNDYAFSSDDATAEFNNLTTKIGLDLTLTVLKGLSLKTGLSFQQVQSPPVSGSDRVFDDQGLFAETLAVEYEIGPVLFFGGKKHVNFGKAWDVTPGVFGTELAEEYEMAENIDLGIALSHKFEKAGKHTLSAETFFLDTSGLAESAFTRRTKTREASGGPGNTGEFSSFGVSLEGGEIPLFSEFRYHLAYAHMGNDTTGAEIERRLAVSAATDIKLGETIVLQPFAEYARFDDADGTKNQDRDYLTAALAITDGAWNLALTGTLKNTEAADGTDTEEELLQVSVGYAFPIGISFDVAYKRSRNAGVDTDVVGALLAYTLEF